MIKLAAAAMADVGLVRDMNEDTVWAQVFHPLNAPPVGLLVVCDGMGGHLGGEFASYWAVEAIKSELSDLFASKDPRATVILRNGEEDQAQSENAASKTDLEEFDLESYVRNAIQKANHVVFEYAQRKPEQAGNAGSTVSMAVIYGNQMIVANAGDSRTYLLRNHRLQQISKDHSLVAHLVEQGQILPEEIFHHPQRNVIYRFLGQKGLAQPDIFYETIQPGDALLLCSDGLWEMAASEERVIELIESNSDPLECCKALIETANEFGGEDNIGVVVAKIE
jgi:protein phosphatase